ncbi:hypothetical protein LIER_43328 [Lithospermum erythrorhizon]|uniref:Uncharacterized protein n=1 Tax=Lithospermum erythrorhizon TaxID=34254 RepID=A0AAV3PVB3_LITER
MSFGYLTSEADYYQSDLQWVEGNSETIPAYMTRLDDVGREARLVVTPITIPAYITGLDDEPELADFLMVTSAFRKMEDVFKNIAARLDDLEKRVHVVEKSITNGGVYGCIYAFLHLFRMLSLPAIAYNYSFKSIRWTHLGTSYNLVVHHKTSKYTPYNSILIPLPRHQL